MAFPANAGIDLVAAGTVPEKKMDSRVRGNDTALLERSSMNLNRPQV
jgi:hypothetical protein